MDVKIFDYPKVKLFMRAFHTSLREISVHKGVFDVETSGKIIIACDSFHFPSVFKSIYLLSLFGFI